MVPLMSISDQASDRKEANWVQTIPQGWNTLLRLCGEPPLTSVVCAGCRKTIRRSCHPPTVYSLLKNRNEHDLSNNRIKNNPVSEFIVRF